MPSNNANDGDPASRLESTRPSLLGPGGQGEVRAGSILQALERPGTTATSPGPGPARSGMGWKLGVVGLILLGGLAWTQWRSSAPADSARPAATLTAQAPVPSPVPEAPAQTPKPEIAQADQASASGVNPASAPDTAPPPATARIETLPTPQTAEAANPAAPPVLAMPSPAAPAGKAAAPAPAVAKARPRPAPERSAKTAAKDPRGARPAVATAPESRRSTAPVPTAQASPVRVASARRDNDVEILAALMSQIEDGAPAPASRAAAVQAAAPSAGVPDNIAGLVATCRGNKTEASLACRARICKGYWGKAEACPARDRKAADRAAQALQARSNGP